MTFFRFHHPHLWFGRVGSTKLAVEMLNPSSISSPSIADTRLALRSPLAMLWIAWAVTLFGGFLWGSLDDSQTHRIPTWCRMASSLLLVMAGWTWYAATLGRQSGGFPAARRIALLITAGMALGTLGDFFNANLLQGIVPLREPILGGLGSFLIGHLCYITACVWLARWCGFATVRGWVIGVGCWQLLTILGWFLIVYRGEGDAALMWAALPYSMLLAGTAGVTAALALHDRRFTLLALGGALFLISDLVLGYRIFQESFYLGGDVTWLTYGPGQMLIVYAIGAMVSRLE